MLVVLSTGTPISSTIQHLHLGERAGIADGEHADTGTVQVHGNGGYLAQGQLAVEHVCLEWVPGRG